MVVVGDFNYETQIGADHVITGRLVAFLNSSREFDFFFDRQQRRPADFVEVKLQIRAIVAAINGRGLIEGGGNHRRGVDRAQGQASARCRARQRGRDARFRQLHVDGDGAEQLFAVRHGFKDGQCDRI